MTAFRFPLAKVLEWRRAQLQAARARFQQQAAVVAGLDAERAALEAAAGRAQMEVRRAESVLGSDLAALAGFGRHVRIRGAEIEAARARAQSELEAVEKDMLEARRRVRLLEKLEQRRREEWSAARDRELEEVAAESHLARLARGR
jgi:flagellar export protein FliJ